MREDTTDERPVERRAYTIPEFCEAYGFGRAHYYNLRSAGLGPREMHLGRRRVITLGAADQWERDREATPEREVQAA